MKNFTFVIKDDEQSNTIAAYIKEELLKNGYLYNEEDPELVCVIGGDGTFLSAVHLFLNKLDKVMFAAINTGNLGFFSDYTKDEAEQFVRDIVEDNKNIERKKLLEIDINGNKYYAINEMRVENPVKTQEIDVYINEEKLETCHCTGISVCTQTGSTAYNRSLKGAVVESGLEIMEITEITSVHHTYFRSLGVPLVLSGNNKVKLESNFEKNAVVCYDREYLPVLGNSTITCTLSDKEVNIAHYRPISYISRLYHLF